MAIPVWARPYNRKNPVELTYRQRDYRSWLYTPPFMVLAFLFYGLGGCALCILGIGFPFIATALMRGIGPVPDDVANMLWGFTAYFVIMGIITQTYRYYFIDN